MVQSGLERLLRRNTTLPARSDGVISRKSQREHIASGVAPEPAVIGRMHRLGVAGVPVRFGEYRTWLTGTPKEAFSLIKTSDPTSMHIVQSGLDKEDLQPLA